MGLHDRKYMSEPPKPMGGNILPKTFTAKFVAAVTIIYLIDRLLEYKISQDFLFITSFVRDFELWRIFTSFFLLSPGGGAIMAAIVLFIFYSLGSKIEAQIGTNRYINLLLTTSAGIAIIALIMPTQVVTGYVGGMLSGLFLAFGMFLGKEKMTLLLFFLIPVTLTGYMLMAFTVGLIAAQGLLSNSANNAIPMLGGCFGAYFYINLYMKHKEYDIFTWLKPKKKKPTKKAPKKKPMNALQESFSLINDVEEEKDDVDEFIAEKVDPILEKIATSGMNSLTAKEKKILAQAKKKMNE